MSEDIPLPKINQRYRDDHAALVTVTSVEEIRGCLCGTAIRIPACGRCTTFRENSNLSPGKKRSRPGPLKEITPLCSCIISLLILILRIPHYSITDLPNRDRFRCHFALIPGAPPENHFGSSLYAVFSASQETFI